MSAFKPIPAAKLLEQIEPDAVGIDVRAAIADLAEAGLVKGYARLVSKDRAPGGEELRDGKISREVWRRINRLGVINDVWIRGSVRLGGNDGAPELSVIGVRFEESAVRKALMDHGIALVDPNVTDTAAPPAPSSTQQPQPSVASLADAPPAKIKSVPSLDDVEGVSIDDAAKIIGVGRTTIYERINDDTLVAKKVGRRTIITTESIRRLLGKP